MKLSYAFLIMKVARLPSRFSRSFYITYRNYCENKSVYEKHEEGPKARTVHGKPYPEWRKPWIKRDGEWSTRLSLFIEKNPNPNIMYALSQIPDLTMQKIKDWWASVKVIQEVENQRFLPQRVATLGSNLAAVHFFIYRQAKIRLKGSNEWLTGDLETLESLPRNYVEGYIVEAVDCTNFHHNGIRYEGVENLSGLHALKWLSLKDNKHVDVWCLDRIAGQNGKSIEYLDISGCQLCTGCIFALSKMNALKYLVITDPVDDIELQAAFSMLEQERPKLLIKAI